jgi:hypothetical protein
MTAMKQRRSAWLYAELIFTRRKNEMFAAINRIKRNEQKYAIWLFLRVSISLVHIRDSRFIEV